MGNSSTQGIPGMDAMNDTLDFVKNLWGGMAMPGMKIPGMIVPTLSVEEINKQIADLKTVESWLTLNMNMLRSTIQALEVQSATISTLQAMGESLSAAVKPVPKAQPAAAKAAEPEPEPEPEPVEEEETPAEPPKAKPQAAPAADSPMPNPAMWWNMLQDQFKQAVGSAMAAEPDAPAKPSKPAKPVKAAKAKPQPAGPKPRKTVAKAAAKTAPKVAASQSGRAQVKAKGAKAD